MDFQLKSGQELMILIIMVLLVLAAAAICVTTLYLYFTVSRTLTGLMPQPVKAADAVDYSNASFWNRLLRIPPSTQNQHLLLDHAPDGIQELDNPTPPWFMFLFYGTIVFGIGYLIYYHILRDGDVMNREYTAEMTLAAAQREAYMKKFANSVNENNVTALSTPEGIAEGKKIYLQYCVACHGDAGQGGVGPNLTDNFWLHGGDVKAIFKTITHGVPDKGMIAWDKQLNPLQVQQVASFIVTLKGTNPPGAKAPQGVETTPPTDSLSVSSK